jgi:argininosuccinate lyase
VPFRQSHGIVAGLVRDTLAAGKSLSELSREELAAHSPELDPADVAEVAPQLGDEGLGPIFAGGFIDTKVSQGGTGLDRVREQLDRARATVAGAPR